jgi:hypothetical protein
MVTVWICLVIFENADLLIRNDNKAKLLAQIVVLETPRVGFIMQLFTLVIVKYR